jgi:hypothetical protein
MICDLELCSTREVKVTAPPTNLAAQNKVKMDIKRKINNENVNYINSQYH